MASTLEKLEAVAVGACVKDKVLSEAKKALEAGEYTVDINVRVAGTFKKGEDYETEVAASVPWQMLAALAMSKLNKETRDLVVDEIVTAMDDKDYLKDLSEEIKVGAEKKIAALKKATKRMASGKVTTDLFVESLGGSVVKTG